MKKKQRPHTPIVSKQQEKFFKVELGKLKAGKPQETTLTKKLLDCHLAEAKGKRLPKTHK